MLLLDFAILVLYIIRTPIIFKPRVRKPKDTTTTTDAFKCFDQLLTMPVEGDANTSAVKKNALPTRAAEARKAAEKI